MHNRSLAPLIIACCLLALLDPFADLRAAGTDSVPPKDFPSRTDVIREEDFGRGAVPPVSVSQRAPKVPKKIAPGIYHVSVVFIVEVDGRVDEVKAYGSSGVAAVDDACVKAVRGWRFRPALVSGEPKAAIMRQPFTFQID